MATVVHIHVTAAYVGVYVCTCTCTLYVHVCHHACVHCRCSVPSSMDGTLYYWWGSSLSILDSSTMMCSPSLSISLVSECIVHYSWVRDPQLTWFHCACYMYRYTVYMWFFAWMIIIDYNTHIYLYMYDVYVHVQVALWTSTYTCTSEMTFITDCLVMEIWNKH